MVSESILIITIIGSALVSPILNYLYNSRCHRIKMCCIECDRTLLDEVNEDDNNKKEIPNS